MTVTFVDTSHHNYDDKGSALDWRAILLATSPAMMCKQTEGDPAGYHFADPYRTVALKTAAAAGATLRGGYHCPIHGDQASINRQVDYFRASLDAGDSNWAMLDVEPFDELGANWPRWTDVLRFSDRWHQVEQRALAGYIPRWYWARDPKQPDGGLGKPDLTQFPGPLISSSYGDNAAMAPAPLYVHAGGDNGAGWGSYGNRIADIWQYGSRAKVAGSSGETDINAYRGSLAQLTKLLLGAPPPPNPPGGSVSGVDINLDQDTGTDAGSLRNTWVTTFRRIPPDLIARLDRIESNGKATLQAVKELAAAVAGIAEGGGLTADQFRQIVRDELDNTKLGH